ncbi:MAG: nuclear transport factor 2 family protein [Kibdelosporangium sp.]
MTPREVLAKMQDFFLTGADHDLWAPDLVVETPFARPGQPSRTEGRDQFIERSRTGRAALPVTFRECNTLAIHDTADPEVVVVEYELVATLNATGQRHSARFIGVLTARDGKIVHWREYQDTARIDAALTGAS